MDQSGECKPAIGEILLKLRRILGDHIPEYWHDAALVVQEASCSSDRFCTIAKTLYNPDSIEEIDDLPEEVLEVVEELYLEFVPYQRPWTSCLISLPKGRSGNRNIRATYSYERMEERR